MEEDKKYKRVINAWCMYDWANSAFATTIMAAMFPPFYRSMVTATGRVKPMQQRSGPIQPPLRS